MNLSPKNVISFKVATIALTTICSISHAATVKWNGGHPDSQSWEEPANWSSDTAPQSGTDSVSFYPDETALASNPNYRSQPILNGTFVIGEGERMISTHNTNGVLRINDGGHLVVARGGTLDFTSQGAFNLAEGGGTMRLTIQAGANVKVTGFYNGTHKDHTIEFIADQSGVSPIEVKYAAHINGGRLEVDLEHYDPKIGSDLILITQLRSAPQTTAFDEVIITGGWSGTMDYNYATADGRHAIALTGLRKNTDTVDIPEPSSYGLILCAVAACKTIARRRRSTDHAILC